MTPRPPEPDRDEPIAIPLDPEQALKALLAVDPEDEPAAEGEPEDD